MKLSVVIPAYNEELNLLPLYEEIQKAVSSLGCEYQIIFVNDGSTDGTAQLLKKISDCDKHVAAIDLSPNGGQSWATMKGIEAATGDYIVLMDADRQNDPADIPKLYSKLSGEYQAVCGWRRDRKDKRIFVLSSKVANFLIRRIFGLKVHDSGCSLRIVPAANLKRITYFKNFHRYIPIILHMQGVKLTEIEVNHRWRSEGQSNYSIFKSLRVMKELLFLRFTYRV